MAGPHDIRRCALQALYQFDVGKADEDAIRQSHLGSSQDAKTQEKALELATNVWAQHEAADATISALAPDWPTNRQPAIDRAILRLGHFEMITNRTPPKVVIDEAIELAKEFSTEKSPTFVNGVLDQLYQSLHAASENSAEAS